MNLEYKATTLNEPTVNRKERLVTGFATTVDVDESGDVVLPQGVDLAYFERVKNVDLEHDPSKAIGTNRGLKVMPDRGILTTTFIGRHALGEDVMTMIEEGILRGLSIAFTTGNAGKPTQDEKSRFGDARRIIRTWKLMAYSIVAQPANAGCTVMDVKSLDGWANRVDDLITKGRILRASAVAVGFPDEPARTVVPVSGPAERGRPIYRLLPSGLVVRVTKHA